MWRQFLGACPKATLSPLFHSGQALIPLNDKKRGLGMTVAKEFLRKTGEGAGTARRVAGRLVSPGLRVFCHICHEGIEYFGAYRRRFLDEEE